MAFLSTPSARRATGLTPAPACGKPVFLSTPSARRATVHKGHPRRSLSISIHALREEGDDAVICVPAAPPPISIHALREEGDVGRTARGLAAVHISIHALREEGDIMGPLDVIDYCLFLSTPSARRAT